MEGTSYPEIPKFEVKASDTVLMVMGSSTAALLADDVTGIGVADDVLIPIINGLGILVLGGLAIYDMVNAEDSSGSEGNEEDDSGELDDLREKGEPYPNHKVDDSGKDLPGKGDSNSSTDKLNPDGTVKQRRYYGPDGKALEDIDYNHSDGDGTHTFPHRHRWDWEKTPPRQPSIPM